MILEPMPTDWAWLDGIAGRFDADALEAAAASGEQQERPGLDALFG